MPGTSALTWFLILSAFARGCAAMTGTEAIANGVPAFKPPESSNAGKTLTWMALLLGAMFLGVSFLVTQIGIIPDPTEQETVLSQLTRTIVGVGWFYYVVQFSTALILFLAGNTSYAGFPRLLYILARDRYAPHWFAIRGDRLAFSFGIGALCVAAAALVALFGSNVQSLLPLYAVGVFTSFTLSQSGMVMHWLRERGANWRRSLAVNGTGAVMTAIVTVVIAATKFLEGAWIAIVAGAVLVAVFYVISRHYRVGGQAAQVKHPGATEGRGAAGVGADLKPEPSGTGVAGVRAGSEQARRRGARYGRPRNGGAATCGVDRCGGRRPAGDHRDSVPGDSATTAHLHRQSPGASSRMSRSWSCCPSSCRSTGGKASSTIRPRCD